ncbi:MAG: SRPBCC domain-containing protein [Acidimicrobiales bacterium]
MTDNTQTIGELIITRIFDAPRDLVFRCMIEPEHLTHFWGPVGVSTPIENITVDARPGGAFETIMVNDSDGAEYPSRGVFVEIVPPERLVWSEPDSGMTTTSTFVQLDDGRTEVRIHQTNVPEMFRSPEAQAGFKSSLDRFAAYLATITR